MKPLSDFTTPRRLIAPISRHFFPVEQPEPFCCTTGLKKGSRFPLIAHFFSSGLGLAGVPAALFAGASGALTAGAAAFAAAEADFAGCLESDLEADAAGFSADALATATFTGTGAGATFAVTAGAEAFAGAVFTAGGALFFA